MQHKQGRDGPSVPVMPEVAVHSDGRLRRPAQEAARPAAPVASTDATNALEAALPARVAQMFTPPPPDFPAPVTRYTPPTYLSTARP